MPNQKDKERFIGKLTDIVNVNITNGQFGVNELAGELGMSRSNLHRRIKSFTGKSVSNLICDIRLDKAHHLIRESSGTVSEIAFECGFHSATYFSKCFKDRYGYPPGEAMNNFHDVERKEGLNGKAENRGITKKNVSVSYLFSGLFILSIAVILILWRPFEPKDKSIAVLPFKSLGNDSELQYLADGVMEAILLNLSKIEELVVISSMSVEKYRNTDKTTREICSELDVAYVLKASFQKSGDRMRLNVELIQSRNKGLIWANNYDREWKDIFSVQSEVAQRVASEIGAIITPEEQFRIEKIPTMSQTAWDLFLKGYYLDEYHAPVQTLERAIDLFKLSLEFDSSFAYPYVKIGAICCDLYERNIVDNAGYIDSILYYADKALSFDNQLAEAYMWRGHYYSLKGNELLALEEFNIATEINPNSTFVHELKGWMYFRNNDFLHSIENFNKAVLLTRGYTQARTLTYLAQSYLQAGFYKKSMELFSGCQHITGDTLEYYNRLTIIYRAMGDFQKSIETALLAYKIDPENISVLNSLGAAYYLSKQYKKAYTFFTLFLDKMEASNQFIPYNIPAIAHTLELNEEFERSQYYVDRFEDYLHSTVNVNDITLALYFMLKGDNDKAYFYLTELTNSDRLTIWANNMRDYPLFDKISSEPEFLSLIGKIEVKYTEQFESDNKWLEEHGLL